MKAPSRERSDDALNRVALQAATNVMQGEVVLTVFNFGPHQILNDAQVSRYACRNH
jgi:hypothetical protein